MRLSDKHIKKSNKYKREAPTSSRSRPPNASLVMALNFLFPSPKSELPLQALAVHKVDAPLASGQYLRKLHDCIGRTLISTASPCDLLHLLHAFAIRRIVGDALDCLTQHSGIHSICIQHEATPH